jgi:mRNA-degrading endonuclease RelE of RelBE toxin-antitoxin system
MDLREGSGIVAICIGLEHGIYVPAELAQEFLEWLKRLQRPEQRILHGVLRRIADTPFAQLAFNSEYWKIEVKGVLPIYAIRMDQARLYCAVQGQDIVILVWDRKKQRKANPEMLDRALRRAREYGIGTDKKG